MTEKKWTPGPWANVKRITDHGPAYSAVAANTLIARVYSTAFQDVENEVANANLVAAAPEGYDLAEYLANLVQRERLDDDPIWAEARSKCLDFMAKCRGE